MKIVRSPGNAGNDKGSVVTVGTFDGVHRAHQEIVRTVVGRARDREMRSVVVTFDPHPREVVQGGKGAVKLLSSMEERIALLDALDVDLLYVIEFTFAFSRIGPREFYQDHVVRAVGAKEVVVGYDHMFGRDREAGIRELSALGTEFGFSVHTVPPVMVNGETVSSTQIRKALAAGDLPRATGFLGRPYDLSGIVVNGDKRGRTLGYPTANIDPMPPTKLVPGHGVYVVGVRTGGFSGHGMLNVGVRPTIATGLRETIEVHIFDFSDDIYGQPITVTFLTKLRDEQAFPGLEALARQLDRDREAALGFLASQSSTT